MAIKKTSTPTKKTVRPATTFMAKKNYDVLAISKRLIKRIKLPIRDFLMRRPHRTFRRTRRRDYVRPLRLPGYWSFTNQVRRILWQHKRIFLLLVLLYGVLVALLTGLGSQDSYNQISDVIQGTSGDLLSGGWGQVGKATLLLGAGVMGSLNDQPTDIQRLYAVLLALVVWLTTVWLLRAIVAGKKPKLRDGLYNAGAPFLSTFLVSLLLIIQLLPVAIAAIGFSAATTSGLLEGGVEAMVFWTVALLLATLSLYWMTTTLIALVVVTLPGMYPWQAVKTAGDLVIGRRVRILLRFLWIMVINIVLWALIMIPIILLDTWIKDVVPPIRSVPIVPVALLVMESLTVVWTASYIYMLYRKVVDDDAAPA